MARSKVYKLAKQIRWKLQQTYHSVQAWKSRMSTIAVDKTLRRNSLKIPEKSLPGNCSKAMWRYSDSEMTRIPATSPFWWAFQRGNFQVRTWVELIESNSAVNSLQTESHIRDIGPYKWAWEKYTACACNNIFAPTPPKYPKRNFLEDKTAQELSS